MSELLVERQRNETPSGLVVEYQSDPRQYWVDGQPVPSVTEIIDILQKDGLPWWGMKVGMVGVLKLCDGWNDEKLASFVDTTLDDLKDKNHPLMQLMKENGLTTNQIRDQAGDRGSSVHQAFEDYFAHGIEPNPANYPPQEEGYVRAVIKFIEEVPVEPVYTELMVGSKRHGYAGRFDLLGYTHAAEVKTGPRTTRQIPEGRGLLDVKTSSGVYKTHFYQLAGYAEALVESGYGRTDYEAVVHLRPDGRYDFKVSDARPSQFLALRNAYRELQGV